MENVRGVGWHKPRVQPRLGIRAQPTAPRHRGRPHLVVLLLLLVLLVVIVAVIFLLVVILIIFAVAASCSGAQQCG
jgi:hypothetical protein